MTRGTVETAIGIDVFFSQTKGIGGKLRTLPEDFIVNELFIHPPSMKDGPFTIVEVTATNWETNLLVRELADRLHISRKRVGFAGTKDKRSRSTQLMSFYKVAAKDLAQLTMKDVTLANIYRSNHPVKIGDLLGNRFGITVRNVASTISSSLIEDVVSCVVDHGGFPNFYGVQRFGVIRPVNYLIGKHILNGDFEQAVMSYVAYPMKGEDVETYRLRERLERTQDFAAALQMYPPQLTFEKALLNKLVVDPEDFVGALTALPKNLLTMFVYAYQSYLFNRMLSERIKQHLPLNEALPGDFVLPVRNKVVSEEGILVTTANVEKINRQVQKGNAFVSGPLLGSDSLFSHGRMGEIEHSIVDDEHLRLQDFVIPDIPYLSSSGSRRSLLASVNHIEWKLEQDTLNENKQAVQLQFDLRKGCYATALLREFMKSPDVRNY